MVNAGSKELREMDLQTTVTREDELNRLTRDREMAVAALTEVADAHRALSGDADSAYAVRRWNAALRQAEETLYDLTERRAGDGHPIVYYFCERPGGHDGTHSMLPHTVRFVHGPASGEGA
jgi:hypothetical protein